MLLTIHNLPVNICYSDIKSLLHSKCGLNDVILDNLESDGMTKKVTVGVAEESDAAILVRKINGLYFGELQLYVQNVRQKKASDQPYHSKDALSFPDNTQVEKSRYQHDKILPHDYQRDAWSDFQNGDHDHTQQRTTLSCDIFKQPDHMQQHNAFQENNFQSKQPYMEKNSMVAADMMPVMMNYNVAPMYYVPTLATANTFLDYGGQAQQAQQRYPKTRVQQDTSFGFGMERGANVPDSRARDWGHDNNMRYENRKRQPSPKRGCALVEDFSNRSESRWDNSNMKTHDVRTRSRSPQRVQFNSREPFFVQNNNPDVSSDRFIQNKIRDQDLSMNREPGYRQRPQGRTETFRSNDFDDPMKSGPIDHLPSSNGSHFTKQTVHAAPPPVWESHRDERNQWKDPHPFQAPGICDRPRKDELPRRTDVFKPRNDRGPQRLEPEQSQFRNSVRGGQKPVVNSQQQTNTTRGPPTKRFPDGRNERDEPQPKRFAAPKSRVEFPKPWMQGPHNSQNASSKPVKGWKGATALPPKPGPVRVNRPATQLRSVPNIPPGGGPPFQQNNWGKPAKVLSLSSLLSRDQTWRSQAAAQIAKELLNNLKMPILGPKDPILTRLKATIRSRIEMILGDQLSVPLIDLVQRYRKKYPPTNDSVLFLAVLKEVKRETNEENGTKEKQPGGAPKPAETEVAQNKKAAENMIAKLKNVVVPILKPVPASAKLPKYVNAGGAPTPDETEVAQNKKAAENMIAKLKNVVVPILKPVPASAKLPKYVNADKKTYNEIKKIQNLEMEEDNLYELPLDVQKALDDECDVLCDLFMAECEVPDNEQEIAICEKISDQAADDFRKLVRLDITKRLLNVNTSMTVRIFGQGSPPKREPLEVFLKQYGVLSLKKSGKSSKMYVAHCNSYKNYDALCTTGPFDIDGTLVHCKPFHVTGPPQKLTRAQVIEQREKRIQDQIDHKGESLLKSEQEVEKMGSKEEKTGQESEKMGLKEEKTAQESEKMGLKEEKTGQDSDKMGQDQEKMGQEQEKAGQEPEKPTHKLEKAEQEQDYGDEDEIDQDLEDVVNEYADLENDYVLENEKNVNIKREYAIMEETSDLDDNDLEDY